MESLETYCTICVTGLIAAAIAVVLSVLFNHQWNVPRELVGRVQRIYIRPKEKKLIFDQPVRRTQDTSKSGLLGRLPPEVRLLIFEHAIGHHLIHLVETDAGLERRSCRYGDNADAWYHPCWKMRRLRGSSLTPVLLTCRHIYSEAIEALYSSNTFHFLRPGDLVSFVDSIARFQITLIRSIKLYVNPTSTGTDMAYAAIWPILNSLPMLRELRLLIAPSVMTKEVWKQHEAQLLQPISTFSKHLKVFDLFLSVFPDWIDPEYQHSCHVRPIKQMEQLQGAHLSKYS